MARLAPTSKPPRTAPRLPQGLIDELERRHAGMARHMARAVVTLVRWDASTGLPPQREAIVRACEAGLDLFLATAREARPATQEELRRVAQLGILQARSSQSVEPILAAYRMAARVAWDEILRAWRARPRDRPQHARDPLARRVALRRGAGEAVPRAAPGGGRAALGHPARARPRRRRQLPPRPARHLALLPRGAAGDRGRAQASPRFAGARPRRGHPAPRPGPEPAAGRAVRQPQPRPPAGPQGPQPRAAHGHARRLPGQGYGQRRGDRPRPAPPHRAVPAREAEGAAGRRPRCAGHAAAPPAGPRSAEASLDPEEGPARSRQVRLSTQCPNTERRFAT